MTLSRPPRFPTNRPSVVPPGRSVSEKAPSAPVPTAPAVDVPLIDAAPFEPDASALRKAQAKGQTEKLEEKTRAQVLQALHALTLLAPGVLDSMAAYPDETHQIERFQAWSEHVRERAAQWAQRWPVEPADLPWVTAALERVVATNPRLLQASHADLLMDLALQHAPPPPSPGLPLEVAAPLAVMTALAYVERAQAAFPLFRPAPGLDLEAAARVLTEVAQDAVSELVPPTGSQEVRVSVFVAALEQGGQTLALLWRQAGVELNERIRERTAVEQSAWETANPEGIDLEPVFQRFREHGARLRRLALLARPK